MRRNSSFVYLQYCSTLNFSNFCEKVGISKFNVNNINKLSNRNKHKNKFISTFQRKIHQQKGKNDFNKREKKHEVRYVFIKC